MMRVVFFIFFLFITAIGTSQEICNNGIDDDNDGLIDLNDFQECSCMQTDPATIIPNPSFELYSQCPFGVSQMSFVDNWIEATLGSSDYFNTCDFTNNIAATPPPMPLPLGNGYTGFFNNNAGLPGGVYKEYVGTCLNSPLKAGITYTLKFDIALTDLNSALLGNWPAIDMGFSLYASSECNHLPTSGMTYECPTAQNGTTWIELGSQIAFANNAWNNLTITFTPTYDLNAIIIGPDCQAIVGGAPAESHYAYLDNLVLTANAQYIDIDIAQVGNYCSGDMVLSSVFIPGASYQWYVGGIAINGANNPTYNIPQNNTGVYSLVVSANGSCGQSNEIVVLEEMVDFDFVTENVKCEGFNIGSIDVNVTNGTAPFSYYLNGSPQVANTFQNLSNAIYTVEVLDGNGCSTEKTITVELEDNTLQLEKELSHLFCLEIPSGSINFLASGGEAPYNYFIDGQVQNSNEIDALSAGVYQIKIQDNNGCIREEEVELTVIDNGLEAVFMMEDTSIYVEEYAKFYNSSISNEASNWYLNTALFSVEPLEASLQMNELGKHEACLIITDHVGCRDTACKIITVTERFMFSIANSFTPNGDDLNDYYLPIISGELMGDYLFTIYNRWGGKVFETQNINSGWDGKFNTTAQPIGVYNWEIYFKPPQQEILHQQGKVTLLR